MLYSLKKLQQTFSEREANLLDAIDGLSASLNVFENSDEGFSNIKKLYMWSRTTSFIMVGTRALFLVSPLASKPVELPIQYV